jgi:hypothetical protein
MGGTQHKQPKVMKRNLLIILASLTVIGTLSLALPRLHAQPANTNAPGTPAVEKEPAMHAALRDLEAAKAHLANARKDFGGHKRAAVLAVDQAITEVKAGIQFADHEKN